MNEIQNPIKLEDRNNDNTLEVANEIGRIFQKGVIKKFSENLLSEIDNCEKHKVLDSDIIIMIKTALKLIIENEDCQKY